MNRVVRRSLAAGAVALVCACTSDRNPLTGPAQPPVMAIQDGRNGGNEHFFFLAPIRPLNLQPPKTAPFNPDLSPVIDICELTAGTCSAQIAHLTMSTGGLLDRVFVSRHFEEYTALWRTHNLNLDPRKTYRIRVLVGTQELGFADVDVVRTFREATKVDRDEFVPLLEDFILPIRFRIEDGALCDAGSCSSASIDLAQGGFVELEATGDRVDIPAQQSGQVVTVTVELCETIDVDLPVFGNCVRVTADPPLTAPLFPPATVSVCSLDPLTLPLAHEQQDLLTLHRQDDAVVVALPHSEDFCESQLGRAESDAPASLAALSLRVVRRAAAWLFEPRVLHATTMVLDVGAGGQTDGFSDFQLALPAKMAIVSLADQTADPNSPVASLPEVVVTDADGQPVVNARVHFQITSTGGGSITPTVVLSNADGHAGLTQWTVGAAGRHIVQASGKGIADPKNNGPAAGFDPFAPAVLHDPDEDEAQPPVTLGTGNLAFTAEAVLSSPGSQLDQQNLLDGEIGGQGIGRFDDANGMPDPDGTFFDFQDAQTFTVGVSGRLAQIKVPLINLQEATLDVTMQIVAVVDGVPDETHSLGEVAIPASAISTNFADFGNPAAWATFDLTGLEIDVVEGQSLAFIVRSASTSPYLYNPESTLGYANGAGYRRNRAATTTWTNNENDFGFQTFVIPD